MNIFNTYEVLYIWYNNIYENLIYIYIKLFFFKVAKFNMKL